MFMVSRLSSRTRHFDPFWSSQTRGLIKKIESIRPRCRLYGNLSSERHGDVIMGAITSQITIIAQASVQIVSCTLSDDLVLSESTGLFNPVLCVSQWNLFWQKNQPMRLCLSNQVRPGREWFPSPLGDFNRLFEGLIGELSQIWHWNMFYFLKWHQSGP